MTRVLITDSTSDLDAEYRQHNWIRLVPLTIHVDSHSYRDGVDISASQLYHRLRTENVFPQTSQPAAGDFLQIYRTLHPGDECIVLVLSAELSGTYQSALLARDLFQSEADCEIHVLDSRSASLGLGFQVMQAKQWLDEGQDMDDILTGLVHMRRSMRLFFAVDTLEYLARGGRISQLEMRLGNLLQLKPVLHLSDGRIDLLDKVRTKPRAVQRILDEFQRHTDTARQAAVLHVDAREEGQELMHELRKIYAGPIRLAEPSPVVGSHVGPGTVGLCWY